MSETTEVKTRQRRGKKGLKYEGGSKMVAATLPISEVEALDQAISKLSPEEAKLYTKSAVYRIGVHKFLNDLADGIPLATIFEGVVTQNA